MALLAHVYVETESYEEARQLAAQARDIFAVTLPEGHWRTSIAVSAEGAAASGLGRFEEAESLLLGSFDALSNQSPVPLFATLATKYLADLYERWGRPDEADRYARMLAD